jgi:hypothetical protein
MDGFTQTDIPTILEAGALVMVQYCPPDRDLGRVTRTVDLQAHARQFAAAYRASLAAGAPDLHYGHVGDAWAAELWTSGLLEYVCSREAPCPEHAVGEYVEHDHELTLNIYPDNARLAGKDAPY